MIDHCSKYGMRAVLFLIISFLSLSTSFAIDNETLPYTEDVDYINTLVEQSKEKKLYNDPYWKLLLHYKKGILGERSLVDDKRFFFSPDGKRNSQKELEATIRAFFSPQGETIHPSLKFIARYSWLKEKLNIDESKMPINPTALFDKFYDSLNPQNAILVFPAGYIDSPASMFGHTFIILEPANGERITSLAINYAAKSTDKFGPIFAFKGIFGLYDGFYSFLPYYEKIKEYNNGEMRDMWEYKLDIDKNGLRRLVQHMVELEDINAYYFFFDENCSYNLLFLVEVSKPDSEITSEFSTTIEPIDTIRAASRKNLVKEIKYRPSLFSKIRHHSSALSSSDQDLTIKLAKNDSMPELDSSYDAKRKAIIYESATEYLQFLYVKNDIEQDAYTKRFMALLRKRNEIDYTEDTLSDIKTPAKPESSVKSNKFTMTSGSFDKEKFIQLSYRPSCHELLDPERGITKNSEIVFGNISGRYYPEDKKLKLQRFDILDVLSIPASDKYYTHSCWKFKSGFEQGITPKSPSSLTYYMSASAGLSRSLSFIGQAYTFFDADLNFSGEYQYNTFNNAGLKIGLLTDFTESWKSNIYGKAAHTLFGDKSYIYEGGISERYELNSLLSFYADYKYKKIFELGFHEYSISVSLFF